MGVTIIDKTKRIAFFDTTKGLLMLCLIWGHMLIFARDLGVSSAFDCVIQNTVPFYRAFFMQTFFLITGFCTTWNVSFKSFFLKNLKTIVFPAFAFIPFAYLNQLILNPEDEKDLFISYLKNGIHWFLAALFLSKILYYGILVISKKNQNFEWLIVVFCFITGLIIRESFMFPNYWSYQHALLMLPFLTLGRYVKRWNINGFYINNKCIVKKGEVLGFCFLTKVSSFYFILIILWQLLGLKLGFPAIDAFLDVHYKTALFHIVFAISGSALILIIAQTLQNVKWINFLGKQSLFVYLIHTFIMVFIMKYLHMYIKASDMTTGFIFYILSFVFSIVFIYLGAKFFEHKYLRWMLGKF